MRTLCFFVFLALVSAAMGQAVSSLGQELRGFGITVFRDRNFRGKSATFRQDVPDLRRFGLNNRISSLRVASGEKWELCDYENFQGRCVVVSGEEPDLRHNRWNDIISSMRRLDNGNITSQVKPYIVLFDQTNYRGNPRNFEGPVSVLTGSNRRARSVTIGRGVWELCEGNHFTGRCVTLDQSVADLSTVNLRNRISSLRPLNRQPR